MLITRLSLFCSLALWLSLGTATAGELSHEEMVCALNPQCGTPFVDRRLRGVTATAAVRPALSFDETLTFAYDSAELTPDSRTTLDRIAAALNDSRISRFDIVLIGHTDARGSAEYNQALSERRAESARAYLVTQHGIAPSRLSAKGYGKSQLLLPSDPHNELNRRVQFQNASTQTAASGYAPANAKSRKSGTSVSEGDGF